jgi:transposase
MGFLHHEPSHCLGADIAKDTIVFSDGPAGSVRTIANKRGAIRAFLKARGADLIVCEPTGGHELVLLEACLAAGIACHRADTLKLKSFIRSFGVLGKSDAIDAGMLAAYGRERWKGLTLWRSPDADQLRLRSLVRRRSELVAMRVAEQNRAKAPGNSALTTSFRAIIVAIKRQILALDAAIKALVGEAPGLARRATVCTAMNGIGPISAAALIACLPELGSMSRRQAAALAGLAPHPSESGARKGYRNIRGGRPEIRTILFMPALRAAAGNGEFAGFYKRLVTKGKKPSVAITAVMRKIVITLNARLRDDQSPQS